MEKQSKLLTTTALRSDDPALVSRLIGSVNVIGRMVSAEIMLPRPQGIKPITQSERQKGHFDLQMIHASDGIDTALWIKEPKFPNTETKTIIFYHGSIGHLTNSGVHPFILERFAKAIDEPVKALKKLQPEQLVEKSLKHRNPVSEFTDYVRHYRMNQIEAMVNAGYRVIAVHSRGFGSSSGDITVNNDSSHQANRFGKPSELGFTRDNTALIEFLIARDFDPKKIILYGESMGASTALDMASQMSRKWQSPRLVVGFEGVSSIAEFLGESDRAAARNIAKAPFLIRDKLDARTDIAAIAPYTPYLILHGNQGDVVSEAHATRLFGLATKQGLRVHKEQIEGGHFTADAKTIVREINECLQKTPQAIIPAHALPTPGTKTQPLRR